MFMFRLAGHLKKDIDEIRAMPSKRLTEWIAFAGIEPIGDRRTDIQTATLCCAIASAAGIKTKLEDWLIDWDAERKEDLTPEEQNKRFAMILNLKI